jgi:hypothetical protein
MKMPKTKRKTDRIFREKATVKIDLGCGGNKQPGWIGIDFQDLPGVDIVQDLSKYPWDNIPDGIADMAMASHVLEHINPDPADPRLAGLIDILLDKKIVTPQEIYKSVGDYRFLGGFLRFMDEVWAKLKPGGQFIATFPYGGSAGYWQDPTHVNAITHVTLAYMDPLAKDSAGHLYNLYGFYSPRPWEIVQCFYNMYGFIEVAMNKRKIDKSYRHVEKGSENPHA